MFRNGHVPIWPYPCSFPQFPAFSWVLEEWLVVSRVCLSVHAIIPSTLAGNDRIATKLAHDGPQVSLHPRSRSKVTWYGHFCAVTKIAGAEDVCYTCWQCTTHAYVPTSSYCVMLCRARYCHGKLSVCLSWRLSVTLRYCDHKVCNTSKLISRPISLGCLLSADPTSWMYSKRKIPKF